MKKPEKTNLYLPVRMVAILLPVFVACCTHQKEKEPRIERLMRPMMGSLVEILWHQQDENDEHRADVVRFAMDRMESLASRMSLHGADSEVVRINKAAGRMPVKVSKELLRVVEMSLEISHLTKGAFDITVGSVEAVWGDLQWGGKSKVDLPEDRVVQEALSDVGYQGIQLDLEGETVFLKRKGMRLDLGGIAKGYIVDQGFRWLQEQGLACFMINAGGDMRVQGSVSRPAWRVGLKDPFEPESLLGVLLVREGAIVTSGTYERYVDTEKGRLSHILDPHTGRPVTGLVSATVLAREAAYADALATALMVKGREGAMALLKRLRSIQGILVEQNGTLWVDEILKERFRHEALPKPLALRFFSLEGGNTDNDRET